MREFEVHGYYYTSSTPWTNPIFEAPPRGKDRWLPFNSATDKWLIRAHGGGRVQSFQPVHRGTPVDVTTLTGRRVTLAYPDHPEPGSERLPIDDVWSLGPRQILPRTGTWKGWTFFRCHDGPAAAPTSSTATSSSSAVNRCPTGQGVSDRPSSPAPRAGYARGGPGQRGRDAGSIQPALTVAERVQDEKRKSGMAAAATEDADPWASWGERADAAGTYALGTAVPKAAPPITSSEGQMPYQSNHDPPDDPWTLEVDSGFEMVNP